MCLSIYIIMCTSLFDKKIHDTFLNIWYLGVVFASQTLARLQLPIFGPVIIRDLNPKKIYYSHFSDIYNCKKEDILFSFRIQNIFAILKPILVDSLLNVVLGQRLTFLLNTWYTIDLWSNLDLVLKDNWTIGQVLIYFFRYIL